MKDNQLGFSLLIGILSLLTLCTVTFILSQTITATKHISQVETSNRDDIWLFTHQLESELLSGSNVQIATHSFTFNLNGEFIRYFFSSGSRIVRQVQGQGFEIVLQEINDVTFSQSGELLFMTITDKKGGFTKWTFIPGIAP